MRGVLSSDEFCHDDDQREVVVNLTTEPMESDAGVEVNRAMKAHEMFARVLKKKALPRVEGGCTWLRDHLEEHRG